MRCNPSACTCTSMPVFLGGARHDKREGEEGLYPWCNGYSGPLMYSLFQRVASDRGPAWGKPTVLLLNPQKTRQTFHQRRFIFWARECGFKFLLNQTRLLFDEQPVIQLQQEVYCFWWCWSQRRPSRAETPFSSRNASNTNARDVEPKCPSMTSVARDLRGLKAFLCTCRDRV